MKKARGLLVGFILLAALGLVLTELVRAALPLIVVMIILMFIYGLMFGARRL